MVPTLPDLISLSYDRPPVPGPRARSKVPRYPADTGYRGFSGPRQASRVRKQTSPAMIATAA